MRIKGTERLPSARRERVLRGRVVLRAANPNPHACQWQAYHDFRLWRRECDIQRLPLSRLLWVLSCSATRKCPAGGTAQEHGKVFVLGNFLWFSCEGREGALHHETGHAKTAISRLRCATLEMTGVVQTPICRSH